MQRTPISYVTVFLNAEALDACPYYSSSAWNTIFENVSNFWAVGFYLGGATADAANCFEPGSVWISHLDYVMKLIPIWDGVQAPCSGNTNLMSSDPATAFTQGHSAANNAVAQAASVGISEGTVIYYDLEPYDSSCEDAVKQFVSGWVERIHDDFYHAGVYQGCNPPIDDYYNLTNRPKDIAVADANNTDTADSIPASCLSSSHWVNNRIHQYTQPTSVTAGGVTLPKVDHDCVRGDVDGHSGWDNECGWPN